MTAFALDRATVRSRDADGRLHVAATPLSKANICAYWGAEIPDAAALGLAQDRLYRLLRHPEELAAAAPSFNNLPLLSEHVPVSAEDHRPDLVVGSTGTDAVFAAPYLKNSLVVWAQDAIDAIESGQRRELSAAYRYRADMTPGQYQGQPYDGVMRDIRGNHVALVAMGRAGPDVVVGDSQTKETGMTKQAHKGKAALLAALTPKLAEGEDPAALAALLEQHFPADDPAAVDDPAPPEEDDDPEHGGGGDADAVDAGEGDPAAVSAPGGGSARLDQALKFIEARTVARMNAIRDAERAVRPFIGDLAVAQDSAAAVYRLALDHLKVDLAGVHPSAYPALLRLAADRATAVSPRVGLDGDAVAALARRFPNAALLKR